MHPLLNDTSSAWRPHVVTGSADAEDRCKLSNGYLLTTSAPLPGALEEQLQKVAEAFPEELFEFEGTKDEVAVYWAEWGGPEKVAEVYGYLDRLASY